jgi:hypothetical protein
MDQEKCKINENNINYNSHSNNKEFNTNNKLNLICTQISIDNKKQINLIK